MVTSRAFRRTFVAAVTVGAIESVLPLGCCREDALRGVADRPFLSSGILDIFSYRLGW